MAKAKTTKKKEVKDQKKEKGFLTSVIGELSAEIIVDPKFKEKARPIVEKAMLGQLEFIFTNEDFLNNMIDDWCAEDMAQILARFVESLMTELSEKIKFSIKR